MMQDDDDDDDGDDDNDPMILNNRAKNHKKMWKTTQNIKNTKCKAANQIFYKMALDDEEEKDEEDEDEDEGDVKDEKLWVWPEVVSVSGALPMLLFVNCPNWPTQGKAPNAERVKNFFSDVILKKIKIKIKNIKK